MSIVVIWKGFAFWPSMTRVARLIKLQFMVLEMKGKERDALRGANVSRTAPKSHKKRPTAVIPGDESYET